MVHIGGPYQGSTVCLLPKIRDSKKKRITQSKSSNKRQRKTDRKNRMKISRAFSRIMEGTTKLFMMFKVNIEEREQKPFFENPMCNMLGNIIHFSFVRIFLLREF